MKLRRDSKGNAAVVFEEIEPFFLDLLRRLPAQADPGDDPAAGARLFSAPMSRGGDGDEFNEDWEQYAAPEIRQLFQSAQETVAGDLARLPGSPDLPDRLPMSSLHPDAFESTDAALEIPRPHAEAWVSVLNQARLVISARRGFGEREMDEDLPFPPLTERDLDLFRVHFYDFVQEMLLRAMGFD